MSGVQSESDTTDDNTDLRTTIPYHPESEAPPLNDIQLPVNEDSRRPQQNGSLLLHNSQSKRNSNTHNNNSSNSGTHMVVELEEAEYTTSTPLDERGGSSRQTGVPLDTFNKQGGGDPSTEVKAAGSIYDTHPYLLNFTNPDTEQRYFNFQYVDNAFIPGKLFYLVWVGIPAIGFIIYTEPYENKAAYTVESFSSLWWIGSYISAALNTTIGIGLFLDSFKQYREIIHLLQIVIGWPPISVMLLITKRPHAYHYCVLFGCFLFCMLIVQCRLRRSLPFVTLWPIICMLVVSFSVTEYWETHTMIEMLYWCFMLMPLMLLSFLEKQTRKSFVERELAVAAINDIEHKTAVNERMIANFFPATPTRDLLQQMDGPRDKAYEDVVMVVTDIAGFTAYTSRSSPPDVIDMLTEMFRAFDSTADRFCVEKIATVGDSYCGAVFPGLKKTTDRCVDAIHFSCSTLSFAGPGLEQRVGVHVGDVVGVFVGCAPPKFDLFGPGIDHARIMEERGRPSYVHISQAVLDATGVVVDSMGDDVPRTEFGVLCQAWGGHTAAFVLLGDEDTPMGEDTTPLDSERIVEALCDFARIKPPATTNDDADDDGTSVQSEAALVDDKDDHTAEVNVGSVDAYDFSKLFLTFNRAPVELRFQQHIATTGINLFCAQLFLALAFVLFVIQLLLQCSTDQDMGVTASLLAILAFMNLYLQFVGTNHRFHAAITFVAYNAMFLISLLALTAKCSGLENRELYVGNVGALYTCISIFGPQYCLDIKLVYRCLMTCITAFLMAAAIAIRRNTIRDEVGAIDPIVIQIFPFVIMSFFPDYSLRSAFRTHMHLKRLQKVARSRGAAMATSALSIMLPTFVTEKIVALANEAKMAAKSVSASETMTSSSGLSQDAAGDIDFNGVAVTWEYGHASLMFIKFHSSDAQFTPEAINLTIQAVEDITKRFEVMKVKTIGSTIMLVAGIDDPRTRQEQLSGMVDAAITIRASVFRQMRVPGLECRMGVHCGPCFGAVIGGNGAVFDLFGDTVNTASRMMSSAGSGSINLSAAANALLMPRLREIVEPRAAMTMKGKGVMEVFAVMDTAGVEHLPHTNQPAQGGNDQDATCSGLAAWKSKFGV